MLREIPHTRQHPGEPKRRWFCSKEHDLFTWHDPSGSIVAFQLCYSKCRNERALYWKADAGFTHLRVDDGESSGLTSDTPIMLADGRIDREVVLAGFLAGATALPTEISNFVSEKIKQCPVNST